MMAVGGAEAPGAGSANVVVADNTPPSNVAPGNPSSPASTTGQGSAGSPGGPLPPVSTQPGRTVSRLSADEAPLHPEKIAAALIRLNEAENRLIAARHSHTSTSAAERETEVAERNLSDAIRQEAERLSRPSSLAVSSRHASARHASGRHVSRHDNTGHASAIPASACNAGDLRKAEARIRGAFPSDAWGADEAIVGKATRATARDRLPHELQRLSVAIRHGALSAEQQEEANVILAGAVDFVLTGHRDDTEPSKLDQLERLKGLIGKLEGLDDTFADTPVFAMLVVRCAGAMHLTNDDVPELKDAIGDHSNASVNNWIHNLQHAG
jgi:hypothetical protein